MPGGYEAEMEPKDGNRGLVVLLCGIPGCGKDAIGRSCAKSLGGSALSQDEHNGNAACTQSAFESMLAQQSSPIFVLRNGVDVGDRLPYVLAARRSGYRVTAVWPSEMKSSSRTALFLASLAGCYGRLYDGGKSGHETLTVDGHLQKPAQVCLNFLQMFRAPSAPGEVDAVLSLSFLQSNLESTGDISLTELGKGKVLPQAVQDVFDGDFDTVKTKMMAWGDIRRPVNDIANELVEWVTEQMTQKNHRDLLCLFCGHQEATTCGKDSCGGGTFGVTLQPLAMPRRWYHRQELQMVYGHGAFESCLASDLLHWSTAVEEVGHHGT